MIVKIIGPHFTGVSIRAGLQIGCIGSLVAKYEVALGVGVERLPLRFAHNLTNDLFELANG